MFVLFAIFLLSINYSNAQKKSIIKEYDDKYKISFLNETDDFEIISANSSFEYGKRHNIVRHFGVPKNERFNFRFDVCVPSDDCLSGYGYIELCILTNKESPKQKGKCPAYFSSIKIEYFGEINKVFNASELKNDTYFRMVGEYLYQYNETYVKKPKEMRFYRKKMICLTAYHEVGSPTSTSQIRFAQPDDAMYSIAGSFDEPICNKCGPDSWTSIPLDSEIHPFQTAVILQDSSSICTPSVIVNLPEYIRIKSSKAKIKSTTVKTIQTTTTEQSKTTLFMDENITKSAVDGFISSKDWVPMVIAAVFLFFLIPQFIIGSIILDKRSSRKVDKFYLMVLEKRQNVRKEILQNQKEALEAEKMVEERKQKILKMKQKLADKLPSKNQKNKMFMQTPKNSTAGSSRIGKREILPPKEVEDIGGILIVGASTKEDEESNVQLDNGKTERSKTGSISKKIPIAKNQSFSTVENNTKNDT